MTLTNHLRTLLAMTAQVLLSGVFIIGYFFLIWQFMKGEVHVPDNFKDAFITLLGVLTGGVGTIIAYWFSRQRPDTPNAPPPSGG